MNHSRVVSVALAVWLLGTGLTWAAPVGPVYTRTYNDCVTAPNEHANTAGKKRWNISAGCDSYQNEFYERPTTQTYKVETTGFGETFAAVEYFQNLDIVLARAGVDDKYFYAAIDLFGIYHITEDGKAAKEGLKYQYDILLSKEADGANGYWLALKEGTPIGTTYQRYRNEGQKDTNGDVGGSGALNGLSITKEDNGPAALGDGYYEDWIDDGRLKYTGANGAPAGTTVLFSRLMPGDASVIEFALEYDELGFTKQEIQDIIDGVAGYIDFRAIKGGPKDPQNYMWNDEYTKSEAGSPYRATVGDLSKSQFGTQGLGNIYELDTLRGFSFSSVPEPAAFLLLAGGIAGLTWARRRIIR